MKTNQVNTVFSIGGSSEGHIAEGAGQATTADIIKHFPLVHKGNVNIVVLRGFMINDKYVPFKPEQYAHRFRG